MSRKFVIVPSLFMICWSIFLYFNKTSIEIETVFGDIDILQNIEIHVGERTIKSSFFGENTYYINGDIKRENIKYRMFDRNYNRKILLEELGIENKDLINKALSSRDVMSSTGIKGFTGDDTSYISYMFEKDEYYYLKIFEKDNNTARINEREVKIEGEFNTYDHLTRIDTFYVDDKIYLALNKHEYYEWSFVVNNTMCVYIEIDGDKSNILFKEKIDRIIYFSDMLDRSIFSLVTIDKESIFVEYNLDDKKIIKSKPLSELLENEISEKSIRFDNKNGINLFFYEGNENEVEVLIVDLSEKDIKERNVTIKYPTDVINTSSDMRIIDNKLYLINGNYMEDDFISVVDILSGETIYQGILKVNSDVYYNIDERN